MTLSSFRIAPRIGHLDRIKRVICYLSCFRSGAIRICTDKPDLSKYKTLEYDWSNSPYAGAREEVPYNVPVPKGESVKMWSFADANLMHDALSGKAVTAYSISSIRHQLIGTPRNRARLTPLHMEQRATQPELPLNSKGPISSPSCTLASPLMVLHYFLVTIKQSWTIPPHPMGNYTNVTSCCRIITSVNP